MFITFSYQLGHDEKKNYAIKNAAFVSLQMRASAQSGFQVSCSSASPYPMQTRSVGTIAASTTCCLRTNAL